MKSRVSLSDRIFRYLDACPPAISGQHGHNSTFNVAIALVQGFNLNPQAALPFMRAFNNRCQPPWTEHELKHKLADANKQQPKIAKSRGYLL